MSESAPSVEDASSRRPGSTGGMGGIFVLILAAIPLLYVLSPFLFAILYRAGLKPPESVMETVRKFWFLLIWYTQSGLPGGEEYREFIDWLAGT